ncbi:MAG: dTMP kinase [Bacteroidetes bacterium RIFCSPLOWO2_02_FULL_36_8]|nr:MAG: dTMP kinase [Bacteroidetes bacterium RIFCSPLOWO2_02_FULL_36_8]OFY70629.1 MAG: dTMP kinase [Bacteroidetes bacterium RIFCSPLOWO2_12_FULL_37_12]
MKKPLFIVMEGLDGSGKTTQIELLKKKFHAHGMNVTDTHEPSDGPIGLLIRKFMRHELSTHPASIAALFAADRLDHIKNSDYGMLKKLQDGFHVICSRYYFSNYAFQGEYVPLDWLVNANTLGKSFLKPDFIFYVNVPPEICIQRLSKGRTGMDIYENLEKLQNTHLEFLRVFEKYGKDENIHLIDGKKSADEINEAIWKIIVGN